MPPSGKSPSKEGSAIRFEQVLGSAMTDKRVEVLRAVHQFGSISEAARANCVSYKAAWQALETLGNLAGKPLIEKIVGGAGGGGARLTSEGVAVLRAADVLNRAREVAMLKIQGFSKRSGADLSQFVGAGLRTSMRNQFPCQVTDIQKLSGAARVSLRLGDGQVITSRVTTESLELLGLERGSSVLALCKAAAVTIAPTILALGGINILRGEVVRRGGRAESEQFVLELAPGLSIVGFAEPGNALKQKQPAMAALDESSIVIALTA